MQTTRVVLKAPTVVSNVHTIKGRAVNVNNDGTVALEADEARPLDHSGSRPPSLTRFRRSANLAEKLQNVMAVTEGPSKFWQKPQVKEGSTIMKKLAIVFALAFAFTTGMAVVTVITHTDQAMAAGFDGRCADLDAC